MAADAYFADMVAGLRRRIEELERAVGRLARGELVQWPEHAEGETGMMKRRFGYEERDGDK